MRALIRILPLAVVAFCILASQTGCSKAAQRERAQKRADAYLAAGEYAKAEIEYLNVLQSAPQDPHAIRQLGFLYLDAGRTVKAIPFVVKAAELEPDDLDVRIRLATLKLAGGDNQEAQKLAVSILDKDPAHPTAALILADAAVAPDEIQRARERLQSLGETATTLAALASLAAREGNTADARSLLQRAIQTDPKSLHAHHRLGMLALNESNLNTAVQELKQAADLAKPGSPQQMHYADALRRSGNIDAARGVLVKITESKPDYIPAWTGLAELAFARKEFDACEKFLSEALSRAPEHYESALLNGRLQLATGNRDKAVTELDRLAAVYSRSPAVRYYLGMAYLSKNDTARAITQFEEAVALNPEFDEAILQLAQLNARRDNAPAAVNALTQLIKRRPGFEPAYFALAAAQNSRGNLDEALATYRRIQNLFPTNANARVYAAVTLVQQRKPADARASLLEALAIQPDHLQALELLVNLDLAERKHADAEKRVEDSIVRNPRSPELQVMLANVLYARQQTNRAEQALSKALELQPDFIPAHSALAKLYIDSQRHPQALERLTQVIRLNTNDTRALLQFAMIQSELKNHTEARAAYEKIVAINPRAAVAYNNLAYLYSEQVNEPDKAYEAARKARELLPNDPATADTLGWILYKRGDYAWAQTLLQESVEKLPAEPEIRFHLGMTQYMLAQESAARASLEQAVASGKEFNGKQEASRRLAVLKIDSSKATPSEQASLEKMAEEDSGDPVVLARLAAIYERESDFDKAVRLYERAVQKNPRNLSATVRLAQIYSRDRQHAQRAMQMARAARNLAPEDPRIAHTLGWLAFQSGDFNWSLGLLTESQRKLPEDPEILHDLAHAQLSVGRVKDAQASALRALELQPDFSRAESAKQLADFAAIHLAPETAAAAEARINAALRAAPAGLPSLVADAALKERAGGPAAIQAYEAILSRYPGFTPAHRNLAQLYRAAGDLNKAYDHATRARSAFPSDPAVARTLGILQYGRKDYARSAQLLRESVASASDAEALFYLGMSYYQLKQPKQAQEILQKALAANLDSTSAAEARRVLSELN